MALIEALITKCSSTEMVLSRHNQIVYLEGEIPKYLYIVVKGQIFLMHSNSDGGEFLVSIIGPGEFFGEETLLLNQPSILCACNGPKKRTRLRLIKKEQFFELLQNPEIRSELLGHMAKKQNACWERMAKVNKWNIHGLNRAISGITWLVNSRGVYTPRGYRIDMNVTQMAKMLGYSREELSRQLGVMRKRHQASKDGSNSWFFILSKGMRLVC